MTSPLGSFHSAFTGRAAGSGIVSICSAHPLVIEAALRPAALAGGSVLIEATCNQVNQEGGYTGMTPRAFRGFVANIADSAGFDQARLILGGDHLGPNPWRHLPGSEAMARAEVMVGDYVRAGFTKIHLDASMACGDDPAALPVDVIASRSAQLVRVAEAAATEPLAYVIGTEVPVPGGAAGLLHELAVTTADSAHLTIESHRRAFSAFGVSQAFSRIVGLVVQPGVEFGTSNIVVYDRSRAAALARVLERQPGLVFEAHSTDYQPAVALKELVEDGFAVLKVGPALTFAMRETLYGLDEIAAILFGRSAIERLSATMERIMVQDNRYWSPYCNGGDIDRHVQRHFSYSDRIRYYWSHPEAVAAIDQLFALLSSTHIPPPLLSQFASPLYEPVVAGRLPDNDPRLLVMAAIQHVLGRYRAACSRCSLV